MSSERERLIFQSTPSAWRETGNGNGHPCRKEHFNPLPPHGGRPVRLFQVSRRREISIHSLRMEGDQRLSHMAAHVIVISIHSLRMEGDFQGSLTCQTSFFISIHSLRMEGDRSMDAKIFGNMRISIHSLRMEGDFGERLCVGGCLFQSTPSAWRETLDLGFLNQGSPFQSTPSAWRETAH